MHVLHALDPEITSVVVDRADPLRLQLVEDDEDDEEHGNVTLGVHVVVAVVVVVAVAVAVAVAVVVVVAVAVAAGIVRIAYRRRASCQPACIFVSRRGRTSA